jgi:hypothetical protein
MLWDSICQWVSLSYLLPLDNPYTSIVVAPPRPCEVWSRAPGHVAWASNESHFNKFDRALGVIEYDTCLSFCSEVFRRHVRDAVGYAGLGVAGCVLTAAPDVPRYATRIFTNDVGTIQAGVMLTDGMLQRRKITPVARAGPCSPLRARPCPPVNDTGQWRRPGGGSTPARRQELPCHPS